MQNELKICMISVAKDTLEFIAFQQFFRCSNIPWLLEGQLTNGMG